METDTNKAKWEEELRDVGHGDNMIALVKGAVAYGIEKDHAALREAVSGMKKPTCDCDKGDLGYHTKECDLEPYGFNEALDSVLALL